MRRRVEIVIDELVLHGFPLAERDAIGEAFAAELQRLTDRSSANLNLRSHDLLQAGTIHLPANTRPDTVGARLGRAVFTGLVYGRDHSSKQAKGHEPKETGR